MSTSLERRLALLLTRGESRIVLILENVTYGVGVGVIIEADIGRLSVPADAKRYGVPTAGISTPSGGGILRTHRVTHAQTSKRAGIKRSR